MKKIRSKKVVIHTDGGCTNNGVKDSYGSYGYVVLNKGVLVQEEAEFKTNVTNNQMEMLGAITALEWCFNNNLKNVQLFSDSKYLIKGCSEWMVKWKKNNWLTSDGYPVKNKMYWKELDHLINKMDDIWFTWEKGHADNEWNNYVDMLCTSTVEKYSEK